jgi:hypothetical protein
MKKILLFAVAATSLVSLSACRKKMDTVAHIYVKDETNASVSNAMVVLYGTNTQSTPQQVAVFDTAYTNVNGLATFNYNELYQLGQAGVAVLDIKAQKGNKVGQGIIKQQFFLPFFDLHLSPLRVAGSIELLPES